jgi:hypothetical protein
MEETIQAENCGEFGLWAIEAAKQIVSEAGFELAKAAQAGNEDDVRSAGNALGQPITDAPVEVYDGLTEGTPEEKNSACFVCINADARRIWRLFGRTPEIGGLRNPIRSCPS